MYRLYVTTDRLSGGVTSDVLSFESKSEADEMAERLREHSSSSSVIFTRVTKLY